ncbi:BON domain-containing protein [Burkholderia sp. Bp9012]|uniref:BON domain-containing protein n=1 Tax=Burkholderia sp. Bp9012 TaxID=2184562 RepID=UPI0021AB5353|nr:BON domain-containing protein [Burkholderia sp. Bp9012]
MKSDSELKKDVEQELEWDPSIDAVRIGVEVHERIVTSTGQIGSLSERRLAFDAAWSAPGVRDVVDQLTVA